MVAADRDVHGIAGNHAIRVFGPKELVAHERVQREEQGAAKGECERPDRSRAAIQLSIDCSMHTNEYTDQRGDGARVPMHPEIGVLAFTLGCASAGVIQ